MVFEITSASIENELWMWAATVEIALMHGWRPRGVPPGEINFLNGFDDWDCPFIFNGGRNMPSKEVRALGEAIHRALKAHPEPPLGQSPPPPCSCGEPLEYAPLSGGREYLTLFADFCMTEGNGNSRTRHVGRKTSSEFSARREPEEQIEVGRDGA